MVVRDGALHLKFKNWRHLAIKHLRLIVTLPIDGTVPSRMNIHFHLTSLHRCKIGWTWGGKFLRINRLGRGFFAHRLKRCYLWACETWSQGRLDRLSVTILGVKVLNILSNNIGHPCFWQTPFDVVLLSDWIIIWHFLVPVGTLRAAKPDSHLAEAVLILVVGFNNLFHLDLKNLHPIDLGVIFLFFIDFLSHFV